jgi:protein-arginine kinase activator protein McsA
MEHVGKAPEQAKALWQRKQLEQALEEAVKAQRYEEAIGLRDQLKKLEPPVEPEKGAAS